MSDLEQNLIKVGMPAEHVALVISQLPPSEAEMLASYSLVDLSAKLPALNGRFVSVPQTAAKKSLSLPKSKLSIPSPSEGDSTSDALKSTNTTGSSLMKGMDEAPDAAFVPTMQFKRSSLPKSAVDTNTSTHIEEAPDAGFVPTMQFKRSSLPKSAVDTNTSTQTGLSKPGGLTPPPGTLSAPSSGLTPPPGTLSPPPSASLAPGTLSPPGGGLSAPGGLTPPSGGLSAPGGLTPPSGGLSAPGSGLSAPGSGLSAPGGLTPPGSSLSAPSGNVPPPPPPGGLSAPGSGLTPPGGNLAPPSGGGLGLKPSGNLAPPPSLSSPNAPLSPPSFAATESTKPLDPQDAVKTSVGMDAPVDNKDKSNEEVKGADGEVKVSAKVDFSEMEETKKSIKPKGPLLIGVGVAVLVLALAMFFMSGSDEDAVEEVADKAAAEKTDDTPVVAEAEPVEELPDSDAIEVVFHELTVPTERAWQLDLSQELELKLEKPFREESTLEFWLGFERDSVKSDIPIISMKDGDKAVLELTLNTKSRLKLSADTLNQETNKALRLNASQYHVAIVYVNSTLSLFINGRLIASDELKNFKADSLVIGAKDSGKMQLDELLVADTVYYDSEASQRFLPERTFSRTENSVLYIPAELVEKDKLDVYHMSQIEKLSLNDESWIHAADAINSISALLNYMLDDAEALDEGEEEVPELE